MSVKPSEGCSVQLGDIQYIEGIISVRWRDIISTLERYNQQGYHKYSGGILSVRWRDINSTVADIQCIGGISSVRWRDITSRRIFSTLEGYHQYSTVITEHPPSYWWYPSTVLVIPLYCTECPLLYCTPSIVLHRHYPEWKGCPKLRGPNWQTFVGLFLIKQDQLGPLWGKGLIPKVLFHLIRACGIWMFVNSALHCRPTWIWCTLFIS